MVFLLSSWESILATKRCWYLGFQQNRLTKFSTQGFTDVIDRLANQKISWKNPFFSRTAERKRAAFSRRWSKRITWFFKLCLKWTFSWPLSELSGWLFITLDSIGLSFNVLPNPNQQNIGFGQGQFVLKNGSDDLTSTSIHVPSSAIRQSSSKFSSFHVGCLVILCCWWITSLTDFWHQLHAKFRTALNVIGVIKAPNSWHKRWIRL